MPLSVLAGLLAALLGLVALDALGVPFGALQWMSVTVGMSVAAVVWHQRPSARAARRTLVEELAALPVKDREGLRLQRSHARTQTLTGLGVLAGVVFTAVSLAYTARTLRSTQEAQVTERYTRAVEQLGNRDSRDARIGAIYALGRLAEDSGRDRPTVIDVLGTYIAEHIRTDARPPAKGARPVPSTDIHASLSVLIRLRSTLWRSSVPLDLRGLDLTRTIGLLLDAHVVLVRADLSGASLRSTRLPDADLREADLSGADLTQAYLREADLSSADLSGADLSATIFAGASLNKADLRGADMTPLRDPPDGSGGYPSYPTNLQGANLASADLRGVKGTTPEEIRRTAGDIRYAKF